MNKMCCGRYTHIDRRQLIKLMAASLTLFQSRFRRGSMGVQHLVFYHVIPPLPVVLTGNPQDIINGSFQI